MQVVGGAVQRVDDPLVFRAFCLCAAFFSQDAVVGKGFLDGGDDGLFGHVVDIADEIVVLFSDDFEAIKSIHVADYDVAGSTRSAYRYIYHCLHDSFLKELELKKFGKCLLRSRFFIRARQE